MDSRVRGWVGPIAILAVLVGLAGWTWGKWPDALVDFGRELYIPWQMSEGRTLYGDLAYFNGPLSPSVNALLFRLTGPSLRALACLNLAIVIAMVAMVYVLLQAVAGRIAATVGGLSFLVFFAFAQFMPAGNYTYMAPYSHEATHGLVVSVAALMCLWAYLRNGQHRWVFASGLAAGLSFLTKAEFPIAIVPAIGVGLFARHRGDADSGRGLLRVSAIAAGGFVTPLIIAFVWLAARLPAGEALRGVAGSWMYVFDARLHALRFYRDLQGTLDIGESLGRIGVWLGRYAAVFVPAAVVALVVRREARGGWALSCAVGTAAAAAVLVGRFDRDWENLGRPFPLVLAAAIVLLARTALGRRPGNGRTDSRILGLSCAIFALLLLLKTMLHASLLHYGFVLAMPAGMALVALAVGGVPAWLDQRGRLGGVFRGAAVGALIGFGVIQVNAAHGWLSERTVELGNGADRFLAHRNDASVAEVIARLNELRAPTDTLVVVPEGVMLNYLARAVNPTGIVNFMPPEVIMFGEPRILDRLTAHPPDWVVLMSRPVSEYGFRSFGEDYARGIYSWIEQSYDTVESVVSLDAQGRRRPTAAILHRRVTRDPARQLPRPQR